MDHPIITTFVLVSGLLLAVVAQRKGWRPSLWTALAVGIGFRLILLITASSDSWQPVDFIEGFKPAGEAILAGQDPVLSTEGSWHFLPMIPYMYALPLALGIPWEIAGRLVTIIADVVLIVLVGRLAPEKRASLSRFQYACNPLVLMISAIHAQVEPVSLVFLAGAYLAARSRHGVAAGALFGLALSAKSWPIILLPVLLAMLPTWRQRLYGLVAAGAVPLLFLASLPLVVDTSVEDITNVAGYLGGVRPIVGEWGWTAWLTGGDWALVPAYSKYGQLALYSTLLLVGWLWRRADRVDLTTAMLLAFMIVTPRMGAQYLMWFAPFLIARPTRWTQPALAVAAAWAGTGYIFLTQFDETTWWEYHSIWSRASILVIPWLLLAMPWDRRNRAKASEPPADPPAAPEPAMAAHNG